MPFFWRSKRPQTLSEEFVQRFWDLKARVDALEATQDDALEYLKTKLSSVTQAERRLDQKRAEERPCEEGMTEGDVNQTVLQIARRAIHGSP